MPTISTTVLNALAAAYFGRVAAQGPATLYAAFVYDATDGITGGTEVAAAGNYSRTAIVNDQVKFSAPAAGVVKNALNIAGPRESQRPGVYAAAKRGLKDLLSEPPTA